MKEGGKRSFRDNVVYCLLVAVGYIITVFPRFILFFFADVAAFIIYYIIRYRRKVVRDNLTHAFPEKGLKEIKRIERRYYRHLGDLFINSLGLIAISKRSMLKHCSFEQDNFEKFLEGRSAIAALSHYGDWEYYNGYILHTKHRLFPVYRPLADGGVDRFYLKARSKFGAEPCAMKAVGRRLISTRKENVILALIADQTAPRKYDHPWYNFFNRETRFFMGIGELATRFGMGVFFCDITRVKRGRYHLKFVEIYDGQQEMSAGEIVGRYRDMLEGMIRRDPSLWTWSHRRWKRKKPAETTGE